MNSLPTELIYETAKYLNYIECIILQQLCKRYHNLKTEIVKSIIYTKNVSVNLNKQYYLTGIHLTAKESMQYNKWLYQNCDR